MYLRLFGNELKYASFQGMDTFTSGETFNILTLMQKLAKRQDYSLTQSIILIESTMVIPTAAGFPLRLTVNGTASMDMQVSGKIDIRKFPKSFVIDGAIKPR